MKYQHIFLFALLLTGCSRNRYIEFNGTTPGISSGVFVIKDLNMTSIYSEFILGEKFHLKKTLESNGFYNMQIAKDVEHDNRRVGYDVYLEPGTYAVTVDANNLYQYPKIVSDSKIQNELSAYYTVSTEKLHVASDLADSLYNLVYGRNAPPVSSSQYDALLKKMNDAIAIRDNITAKAFDDFVTKNPDNEVESHILALIDYKKDPVSYYHIYQKFTDAQKNTAEGKTEGDELGQLAKLAPGAVAPALTGKTIDDKKFDFKSIHKKVILVEFWRSDNELSRQNHTNLLSTSSLMTNKDFTVVSVGLDTKQDAWADAVKKDNIPGTSINDFKGETSPNMVNWGVSSIPTYDLLDSNWHFIKRDVGFDDIYLTVKDYLKTH